MNGKFKVFDHTPEFKARQQAWREHHTKLAAPSLHSIGMRIKNGPHTNAQIARATGISVATIEKLRKFEHGGMPLHSTIVALEQFFEGEKKRDKAT